MSRPLIFAALALLVLEPMPAVAQGPAATPENDELRGVDRSGQGAVLCLWQSLVTVQAVVEKCGWERQPIDDAIDDGIAATNAFIIANSSTPVTQDDLDARIEQIFGGPAWPSSMCAIEESLDTPGYFAHAMREQFASQDFGAMVADMLSVPREPVLNPCF